MSSVWREPHGSRDAGEREQREQRERRFTEGERQEEVKQYRL